MKPRLKEKRGQVLQSHIIVMQRAVAQTSLETRKTDSISFGGRHFSLESESSWLQSGDIKDAKARGAVSACGQNHSRLSPSMGDQKLDVLRGGNQIVLDLHS